MTRKTREGGVTREKVKVLLKHAVANSDPKSRTNYSAKADECHKEHREGSYDKKH